jgi:hypothetical protein
MAKDRDRDQRLAEALRENLRKRKAQAREHPPLQGEGDHPAQPDGGGVTAPDSKLQP